MAAKGQASKQQVMAIILETFPGAFVYDKELRIPMLEGGENIQIKVALTCAKTNVEAGGDTAVPVSKPAAATEGFPEPAQKATVQATDDERQRVIDLMNTLGL